MQTNKKQGFTLIELVIVLSLLAVVSLLLLSVFITSYKSDQKNQVVQKRVESVRVVTHLLDTDIRKSSQHLTLNKLDGCYLIIDEADSSQIEYCFNNQAVFRQGVFLIDEIKSFQLLEIENKGFTLVIEDSGGGKYEQNVYFRRANKKV